MVLLVAPVLAVGVIALLGNLPTSDLLHRAIVARFWQEPDIFVFVWCGLGVAELEKRLPRAATAAVVAASVLLPLGLHEGEMDMHASTLVRSYGSEILRAAPPGALLFTKGDLITNTLRYLQAAEGQRPDVRVVDTELLGFSWARPRLVAEHPEVIVPGARYAPGAPDGFTAKQLFDANIARSPVLLCGGVKPFDTSADASYGRWPWGLCELVHPGSEAMNVAEWISSSEVALPRIDFARQAHPEGSWEGVVWGDYWEVRQARAVQLLAVAGADPTRQPRRRSSRESSTRTPLRHLTFTRTSPLRWAARGSIPRSSARVRRPRGGSTSTSRRRTIRSFPPSRRSCGGWQGLETPRGNGTRPRAV